MEFPERAKSEVAVPTNHHISPASTFTRPNMSRARARRRTSANLLIEAHHLPTLPMRSLVLSLPSTKVVELSLNPSDGDLERDDLSMK